MNLGANSAPADPWPFLAVALAVIAIVAFSWTYILLRSHRRRAVRQGLLALPPWGRGAVEIRISVDLPGPSADQAAAEVIRRVGGVEVRVVEGRGAIGWVRPQQYSGRFPLNSHRQGYELGIAVEHAVAGGPAMLICAARPQHSIAIVGSERTADLASQLARGVTERLA
jgi:hypothetical protein